MTKFLSSSVKLRNFKDAVEGVDANNKTVKCKGLAAKTGYIEKDQRIKINLF